MTVRQRVILVGYCFLLAYCCVWVPWHITQGTDYIRIGYGWVWAGPSNHHYFGQLSAPDLPLIVLRIVAATGVASAFFVAFGRATRS